MGLSSSKKKKRAVEESEPPVVIPIPPRPSPRRPKGLSNGAMLKVINVGDAGCGKSCWILRVADETWTEEHISTIGSDFKSVKRSYDGKDITFQLWDTAGQERFRTITSSYYRGAHAVILFFDITNRESFQNIRPWLGQLDRYANEVIVGAKSDLDNQRIIPRSEAEVFCNALDIRYVEISSKENLDCDEVLNHIYTDAIEKRDPEDSGPIATPTPTE